MISWKFIPRNTAPLVVGALLLYYVIKALRTRVIKSMYYRTCVRSEQPIAYWITVAAVSALAVGNLISFVIVLF